MAATSRRLIYGDFQRGPEKFWKSVRSRSGLDSTAAVFTSAAERMSGNTASSIETLRVHVLDVCRRKKATLREQPSFFTFTHSGERSCAVGAVGAAATGRLFADTSVAQFGSRSSRWAFKRE
ncbi:uncharacterized protein V6R79_006843 [Siganus canaliculatus]